jgi:putative PIN family toxin of toxin-antitoxin system
VKVVVDTNVLVSGLLKPLGPPGVVVRMVAAASISLCHDVRILYEYRDVLSRPKFSFQSADVEGLLDQIRAWGTPVVCQPLGDRLPDPDDEKFLEAALAGRARFLVTGNKKHFPSGLRRGVTVLGPREFVEICRREE